MPESCSFRQVEEKHVSCEVELMAWSPRMDLIALANIQAEVVLHRLSWQKVWTVAPPAENLTVTGLAWRPDGKVLAVSYSNGRVTLCDVENSTNLHDLELTSAVTSLTWVTEVRVEGAKDASKDSFHDSSATFLPNLPQFPRSYAALGKTGSEEKVEDGKKLKGQNELNLLLVGTDDGQVHMFAFGIFPVGRLHLADHDSGKSGRVLSGFLSHDLHLLSLLVEVPAEEKEGSEAVLISFDTTLLASRKLELRHLALKVGHVLTLLMYMDTTVQQMCEAWEDILLEMDSKLHKFAEEKHRISSGTVSNDFLRLLMFGIPSDELQAFLLHELTDKGLKKLGHSIESSYSNIQKLVLKHLQSVGGALLYHLREIQGMSMWYDKFGVLGLSTQAVQDTIAATGAFLLKASELQQVIDGSMKNFKAFFRWLYVVIKNLNEEPVPPELTKMTQQDLNFVAQFLKENFTEEITDAKSGFKLEKVGQYLKNEELSDPPDSSSNPWVNYLEENPALKGSSLLYPWEPRKSLLQVQTQLKESIDTALKRCAVVIGKSLQCVSTTTLFPFGESEDFKPRISQHSKTHQNTSYIYTVMTSSPSPCNQCHIIRQATTGDRRLEVCSVEFGEISCRDPDTSTTSGQRCSKHQILDVAFYDDDTLSVLLQEEGEDDVPVLAQVPLSAVEEAAFSAVPPANRPVIHSSACIDVGSHIDSLNYRRLENMKASRFSVSGTRKVACVLFSSRRRVRLFLMDVEDEEDDDEDEDDDLEQSQNESRTTEVGTGGEEEGDDDENKENSRESAMDV